MSYNRTKSGRRIDSFDPPDTASLRRLHGVRRSGMVPVADHTSVNPAAQLKTLTLSAAVVTTPAFGTSETWTVASVSGLPISGQQIAGLIDGELVLITAYSTTSLTVIRGVNGYASTHANAASLMVDSFVGLLSGDGGRVGRRRVQVNVDGGVSGLAPLFENYVLGNQPQLFGEVGILNPVQVRMLVEFFGQPVTRGADQWAVGGSYTAGRVVGHKGVVYAYTGNSSVGTPPASDANATSLGDARHAIGSVWDPAFTYATGAVVYWRGAYWTASASATGDEPRLTSTKWTPLAPKGSATAGVQAWTATAYTAGTLVTFNLPNQSTPAVYMSLGVPAAAAPFNPVQNSIYWALLSAVPVDFPGQDATRTVTIQGGAQATANLIPVDLAQGAYFFNTLWLTPVSYATGTTATAGAAGMYPLSSHPLIPGVDSVACTAPTLNPGPPTNYCAWQDFPVSGLVPLPPTYSAGTTYAAGQTVLYNGAFFRSLKSANTGNTPTSGTTSWWDQIQTIPEPTAILGVPTKGPGRTVVLAVRGDSIAYGSNDTPWASDGTNATESGGYLPRAISNKLAWVRVAKPGDRLKWQAAARAQRRKALALGATHVLYQLGVNDISDNYYWEEVADWMYREWVEATGQGLLVAQTTITPQTTGTYTTTTGQTGNVGNTGDTTAGTATSERQKLNTWLRTVPSPLSAVVDVAASVEVYDAASNGGNGGWVWKLISGTKTTTDGIHPDPNAHAAIAADATDYGGGRYGLAAYLATLKAPIA